MGKTRLHYLDTIKAFAMVLVIWGHCGGEFQFPGAFMWIYSFHVPIYFVISGYLKGKKYCETGINKIDFRLFIPYLVFSVGYAALIGALKLLSSWSEMVTYFCNKALPRIVFLDGQIATWFLACLLLCELIIWVELKIVKSYTKLSFLNFVLCVVACYIPFYEDAWAAKVILRVFPAVFCMTIGGVVAHYEDKMPKWLWGAILVSHMFLIALNGQTYMYHMTTGNYPILYGPQIVISSLAIFGIGKYFLNRNIPVVDWFGQNTLIVLGTHQAVLQVIYPILGRYHISLLGMIPPSITLTILVVVIEIPIIFIINKWFSWTLGKKIAVSKGKQRSSIGAG